MAQQSEFKELNLLPVSANCVLRTVLASDVGDPQVVGRGESHPIVCMSADQHVVSRPVE